MTHTVLHRSRAVQCFWPGLAMPGMCRHMQARASRLAAGCPDHRLFQRASRNQAWTSSLSQQTGAHPSHRRRHAALRCAVLRCPLLCVSPVDRHDASRGLAVGGQEDGVGADAVAIHRGGGLQVVHKQQAQLGDHVHQAVLLVDLGGKAGRGGGGGGGSAGRNKCEQAVAQHVRLQTLHCCLA
jgi:hypothetical protein